MKTIVLMVVLFGAVGWASATSIAQESGGNGQAEHREPADENQPETTATEAEKRLRGIIDALQVSEKRFQNLETVIRVTEQEGEQAVGDKLNVPKQEDVRHTIQQGERFWFHSQQVQTLISGEQVKTERMAAFDGEITRSIDRLRQLCEPPRRAT